MDLTEELFNEIDAYLNNRLNETEQRAFQQRLEQNPELRREVDLQRHVGQGLEAIAMKRQLQVMRRGLVRRRQTRQTARLAVACLVVGVLSVGGWFLFRPDPLLSPPDAFIAYYAPEPRSRADASLPTGLSEARHAYYDQHYTEALRLLSRLPTDSLRLVPYYRGLTLVALNRPREAAIPFVLAGQSPDSTTRWQSDWYAALALLQADNGPDARSALIGVRNDATNPYAVKAEEVLQKLRQP